MEQRNDSMSGMRHFFDRIGHLPHIPAAEGDYVDEASGYLFCGVCHTPKEY